MLTRQRFEWYDIYDNKRHFLLMPSEAKEFHDLIGKGISFNYAFERLTGYDTSFRKEIRLVQEIMDKPTRD